jgi:hypothetical protein
MERTAERKAELRKADCEAIERAIATGADPFDLVMAATGEGAHICVRYVQQHPFLPRQSLSLPRRLTGPRALAQERIGLTRAAHTLRANPALLKGVV